MNVNIYRATFSATCPENGAKIDYALEIRAGHVIMAEAITQACAEAAAVGKPYHENIADFLVAQLGGEQTIVAHHHGVDIETRRGG